MTVLSLMTEVGTAAQNVHFQPFSVVIILRCIAIGRIIVFSQGHSVTV